MTPKPAYDVIPMMEVPVNNSTNGDERLPPVILVVDDEHVIADTLSVILSRSGFSVFTAYDAASALEMASIVPPQLLLSDVMMGPGMNGVNMAIVMVNRFPECKVLLFSGCSATTDLLHTARKSGYNFTLLQKPIHPTDLLRRIRDSLALPTHLIHGRAYPCETVFP